MPCSAANHPEHTLSSIRTHARMPSWNGRMIEIMFCGTSKRTSTIQRRVRSSESYALVRSIKHTYSGNRFFRASSCSRRITNIISVIEQFGRKPLCSSGKISTRSRYSRPESPPLSSSAARMIARRPQHCQHKACPKAASPGLTLRQLLPPAPPPPFSSSGAPRRP